MKCRRGHPVSPLFVWIGLICRVWIACIQLQDAAGFVVVPASSLLYHGVLVGKQRTSPSLSRQRISRQRTFLQESNDDDDDDGLSLPENFNPFQQVSTTSSSASARQVSSLTSPKSLREITMSKLIGDLLNSDVNESNELLDQLEDFLLQPLFDKIPQTDGLYPPGSSLDERLAIYKAEMTRRIDMARTDDARRVLTQMRDFCVSRASSSSPPSSSSA
eukprot:scaffold9046_cov60-Attheya_sp.AAC.1